MKQSSIAEIKNYEQNTRFKLFQVEVLNKLIT